MKDLNSDNLPQALELFESIPFGFENAQEYELLYVEPVRSTWGNRLL